MIDKIDIMLIDFKIRKDIFIDNKLKRFINDEKGGSIVELAIIMAIIAVVCIIVAKNLGKSVTDKGSEAAKIIDGASFN